MVHISAVNNTEKNGWIKRIIENNNPKCSKIMLLMLQIDPHNSVE